MTEIITTITQPMSNTLSTLISNFNNSISSGKFPFFECAQCAHRFAYPRVQCPKCGSGNISIQYSKGEGRILTYTIVYRSGSPTVKTPFVVAIVELSEGIQVNANILYSENISIESEVRVRFLDLVNGIENGRTKKPIFELV